MRNVITLKNSWDIGLLMCHYVTKANSFNFSKALVVTKMTRYELEKLQMPDCNKTEFMKKLKLNGTDFESLKKNYDLHKSYENYVIQTLERMGVETRVVNRMNCDKLGIEWCDAVFPIGGDGTFLLAASFVCDTKKPVIGLNSDPSRSEGHLCLPKKYSLNLDRAVEKILSGDFSWRMRSRIRTTLKGLDVSRPPVHMHNLQLLMPEHRFAVIADSQPESDIYHERCLPYLALNEVFVGEYLSARVSYFDLELTDYPKTKVKSSGLCVCTGTGSTSWHLSMNRLNQQSVKQVLHCAGIAVSDVTTIISCYNNSLIFDPEELKLGYTIKDIISAGVWPHPPGLPPRGFSKRIDIHSKCIDAGLVIDGGISYPFNEGTVAKLEIHPEDALRTIVLNEN